MLRLFKRGHDGGIFLTYHVVVWMLQLLLKTAVCHSCTPDDGPRAEDVNKKVHLPNHSTLEECPPDSFQLCGLKSDTLLFDSSHDVISYEPALNAS